ncbi:SDR family NAD(P)-dependent oxidoreductase [Oceanibacterium hippocampi]|uniref:Putative oxidoreductase n=1 Tax=Oceanibacterium hippocampi TaxID=745714 RepID=A0A1Y5U4A1_9PROT|nr:SDR family NAD(P)-dependent oxidoreductase [Oceanibacterium hippocampi]SLN76564.1 putative oxidoreductase [Oceanibacterium hippocampi]
MADFAGIQVRGATALVTGASGGIGGALVEVLLENGATKVIAADRTAPEIVHPRVMPLALDITDPGGVTTAADRWADHVTILINNAGINANARLFTDDLLQKAKAEIEVNYLGTLAMMLAFAPAMARHGRGHITNLLSFVGVVSNPAMAGYSASKAAAHIATIAARAELAPMGVGVLGVYPQVVDTEMSRHLDLPKIDRNELAAMIIAAIEEGKNELFPGPAAEAVELLRRDPAAFQTMLVERLGPARPQFQ